MVDLIDGRRILVCVGTGGVGKTTVSSALAVAAARRGHRALVLTIDPARRLADALGLASLGSAPERLSEEREHALGVAKGGELSAMMLDMKGTFDALVERLCPDEATRARILGNPLYQHISDALAGSVEYAAMEKVYELAHSDAYDVIVLDTPPAQHALDFLEAPERLVTLLDSSFVRLLVQPAFSAGRLGWRAFQGITERTLALVARLSGVDFLKEISELLLAVDSLSTGFKDRARAVRGLLQGEQTAFLLIAGPSPTTASGARSLVAGLDASGIALAGVVINRVHRWPVTGEDGRPVEPDLDALEASAGPLTDALERSGLTDASSAVRAAIRVTRDYAVQVQADASEARRIRASATTDGHPVVSLPALQGGVDEVTSLVRLADALVDAHPRSDAPAGGRAASTDRTGRTASAKDDERGSAQ